jgi:hypothetical protein
MDDNVNESIEGSLTSIELKSKVDNSIKEHNEPEWDESHEKVLIEWADKAQCFRWLHGKSFNNYRVNAMWFTIPVIVMSTITGTANFAQDRFPDDIKTIAVMIVGTINIFAGILTTISQYLKVNELLESHRVAGISWSKFSRDIKIELAKDPRTIFGRKSQRTSPLTCLKKYKEEFDRLMEVSPNVDEKVVQLFMGTFDEDTVRSNSMLKERRQRILYHENSPVPGWFRWCVINCSLYECFKDPINGQGNQNTQTDSSKIPKYIKNDVINTIKSTYFPVARPEICDEIISVAESKHPWMDDDDGNYAEIKMQEAVMQQKQMQRQMVELQKSKGAEQVKENVYGKIGSFIISFKKKINRMPLINEIKDNLSDIDPNDIDMYFIDNV